MFSKWSWVSPEIQDHGKHENTPTGSTNSSSLENGAASSSESER